MPSFKELNEWRLNISMGMAFALAGGLWFAYQTHDQIHVNSFNVERIEGRLDKKYERLEQRIQYLEKQIHDIECPPRD